MQALLCCVLMLAAVGTGIPDVVMELRKKVSEARVEINRLRLRTKACPGPAAGADDTDKPKNRTAPDYDLFDYLKPFARRNRNSSANLSPTLRFLFETPIVQLHLSAIYPIETVNEINQELSAAALLHYRKLFQTNAGMADLDPAVANDVFFNWQRYPNRRRRAGTPRMTAQQSKHDPSLGWRHFEQTKAFAKLESAIQRIADKYLTEIGLGHVAKRRVRPLESAWAAVHHEGVMHNTHVHPDTLLSGVYYVKVPENSGQLLLKDPRSGPTSLAFQGQISIPPVKGELVLFPSWLSHQVTQTRGKAERVAIAFNLDGEWRETTGLNTNIKFSL